MINVENLKVGDIMTFDGERDEHGNIDPLSHLIMILTDSEVSHGALYVQNDPPALADAALSGLHAHLVANQGDVLRPVHICRLKSIDQVDITPVINVANKYIAQNLVYPMPNLIMLGLILVYKNISHVSIKQKIIIGLLKLITAKIKSILDDKKYDGKHPMICSEFVYQCYLEASKEHPELKLLLKNGDLHVSLKQRTSMTLLDHFIRNTAEKKLLDAKLDVNKFDLDLNVNETESELIQQAIDGAKDESVDPFTENQELSSVVRHFLVSYQKLKGKAVSSFKDLIETAKEEQAFFVTPNDLLCHISNAENCGKFDIYRNSEILR